MSSWLEGDSLCCMLRRVSCSILRGHRRKVKAEVRMYVDVMKDVAVRLNKGTGTKKLTNDEQTRGTVSAFFKDDVVTAKCSFDRNKVQGHPGENYPFFFIFR